MVGRTLGHYEILEPLGAGGMGEVYRARDTTLRRDVAIKVLPEDLSADVERLARLEREAHLLAALNHSNIATIHSLDEHEGTRFLVMELVRGQSLEELLADGPLQVDDALDICRQIAQALEAAHEQGIIHRDLKPANVLVTPEGHAKVLDFGLAKTVEHFGSDTDLSRSPTITIAGTQAGVIMGTAPYMSPEQVRGKRLDKRSDIWAFGCVLYEALTGDKAFDRETVADTLAAIIQVEPPWDTLPAATPQVVRALLHRCLRKDSRRRLHDVADARIEIEDALGLSGATPVPIAPAFTSPPLWRRALPWGVAAAALVITVTVAFWATMVRTDAPPPDSGSSVQAHFSIQLPAGLDVSGSSPDRVAISPDGTKILYRANSRTEATGGLYLRDLDELEPTYFRDLPAGFFSPNGNWIAFFQDDTLMRVSLSGGTLEHVCDLPWSDGPRTGTWTRDGWIVFRISGGELWRCPEGGGDRELIATPDAGKREQSYWWPRLIPNRNAVVFGIMMADGLYTDDSEIAVLDLGTLKITRGIARGNMPSVLPTGHLLYTVADRLFAQALDLDTYETYGTSAEVLTGIDPGDRIRPAYAVSENGTLAYVPGVMGRDELVWIDEQNVAEPALSERQLIYTLDKRVLLYRFELSHDRRLMAAEIGMYNRDIETYELSSGKSFRPLVRDRMQSTAALLPNEAGFFFHEYTADGNRIYRHDFSGAGEPELLDLDFGDYSDPMPISVSPDGRWMTVQAERRGAEADILLVTLEGQPSVEPWLATEADENTPLFSPDGRWIAYQSDLTGRRELYVRELFAAESEAVQVTFVNPYSYVWGPGGNALYYYPFRDTREQSGRLLYQGRARFGKVSIGPDGEPGEPQLAWEFDDGLTYFFGQGMWGIGADGRLLASRGTSRVPTQINVHTNWFDKVKELVPTSR